MHKGFLGKQKTIKIRLPIKLSQSIDEYTDNGSKKAAVTRVLIELGLKRADKMQKVEFMKLVHEFKSKYLKEN